MNLLYLIWPQTNDKSVEVSKQTLEQAIKDLDDALNDVGSMELNRTKPNGKISNVG